MPLENAYRDWRNVAVVLVTVTLTNIASCAFAAPQSLVLVEGPAATVALEGITTDGSLTFRAPGAAEPMPVEQSNLVRWGNPLPPRPQTIVVLAGGGRLVTAADWAGGAAVQLHDDEAVIISDTWDKVTLPKSAIRGIVFAQRTQPDLRVQLAEQLHSDAGKSDSVRLANGDRLTGELLSLERGSLSIKTAGGETKLPLSRVEAIVLRDSKPNKEDDDKTPRNEKLLLGTRDGSMLPLRSIANDGKTIAVELVDGVKLAGGKVEDIVFLQSLSGNVVYLSDLPRVDYRFVPYLSMTWPLQHDKNSLGGALTARGKQYLKGLGMHSAARATYQFDRDYARFDALIAIDDAAHGRGSVVFGAYVLRDGKWDEAFKSETIRGSDEPQPVSIDLRGVKGLTITVDFGERGDELDYADWLDARLVR